MELYILVTLTILGSLGAEFLKATTKKDDLGSLLLAVVFSVLALVIIVLWTKEVK